MEIFIPKGRYKDVSGERIYWPGQPYFDSAFRRTFKSEQEKRDYMQEHKIISAGQMDSDDKKLRKDLEKFQEEERIKSKKKRRE